MKKLSNRDLAQKVGVSPTNINNMLSGTNKPNVETVIKLVAELGINGHWLLTGEGGMYSATAHINQYAMAQDQGHASNHVAEPAALYSSAECDALRIEVAYLKQQVSDKEEIITLLRERK